MHAILYIAGRAIRLGPIATARNKVLLDFEGKSLLERHVMILAKLGVSKLYLVTGHLRENIQEVMPHLSQRYGLALEELYNADFTEGSVLSMHASLPALANVTDSVLLMDGDVLYDARMLQRLLDSPHRTALLVDRDYSTIDDDPVLVPLRSGRPFEFVKKWKPAPGEVTATVGESVGFFKVHSADLPVLIRETCGRAFGPARADSFDEVLRILVKQGLFGAEDVTGLPWTEIDFPHDLDYAAKFILPALQH
jgi:choline kinase